MTRKDFKAIAEVVANMTNREDAKLAAESLAIQCKKVNPRFDFAKFYAACKV
jgi:hypothetical protein